MKECGELIMVRCERFVIEKLEKSRVIELTEYYNRCYKIIYNRVIFDRVNQKVMAVIDTGNEKLDEELAEAVLTMLNIKYVGRDEEE